ncbi:MAG: hypothetical protein ACKVQS_09920 [Fimbriimonadaceae bacterium]
MDDRKIYSEQEAANLIVAAAKLQESDGDGSSYSAGVSWEEMQRMAEDVGVDPEYLRKALSGQTVGSAKVGNKPRSILGMPMAQDFERVVDAELPPESFDVITSEFYNPGYGGGTQGGMGGPSVIGRMMKGQFYEGILYGTMEVSSRHGRTRIKATTSSSIAGWAIFMPIMLLTFIICMGITSKRAPEMAPLVFSLWGAFGAALWAGLVVAVKAGISKVPSKLDRIAGAVEDEADMIRQNLGSVRSGSVEPDRELRENLRSD